MCQLLPQERPHSVRPRKPSSRNHRLAPSAQTPRHQGYIYQRPRKGHLCAQPREGADYEEGRAAARCQRRQVEKGHKARQVHQRECKRYLGPFPRLKVVCLISSTCFAFYDHLVQHFKGVLGIPRISKLRPLHCILHFTSMFISCFYSRKDPIEQCPNILEHRRADLAGTWLI